MNHWTGAITGLLALRLATSRNLAAGAAGVTTLTAMGLSNLHQAMATMEGYGLGPSALDPLKGLLGLPD